MEGKIAAGCFEIKIQVLSQIAHVEAIFVCFNFPLSGGILLLASVEQLHFMMGKSVWENFSQSQCWTFAGSLLQGTASGWGSSAFLYLIWC